MTPAADGLLDEQHEVPPRTVKKTIKTDLIAGFATESAKDGESVRVAHQFQVTADSPYFYMFVNQISDDFLQLAGLSGDSVTKFFIVQRPDGEADVYTDYPVIAQARVSRAVTKGDPLYVHDIGDIVSYRPEGITLEPTDTVICVMKVGWKYGLFFDASRKISQDGVWAQLGALYQDLHVDRVLANIRDRIRLSQRPHIITEGRTDWRHIEAARRALGVDMSLGYPTTSDSLGDSALFQVCERLSKFGPPNTNKVIAIFDRDNPQVLAKLKARGDLDAFQAWGNNVYSIVLPMPAHRVDYKNISVEMLYTDTDIATRTSDGKRLYFNNELRKEIVADAVLRYAPIPPAESAELTKKPYDDEAELIVDDNGCHVGLSKGRFADLVHARTDAFGHLDMSAFAPIFQIIRDILAHDGNADTSTS
ncbi:hypothetical protein ACQP00_47970 [Dactylosporangium sp. CS-047395]|uniref:hypothetical protein n=1 Tax=Dactylosporangium sp. CS-047395 TaxID=3239936 RepID=UPI003D928302